MYIKITITINKQKQTIMMTCQEKNVCQYSKKIYSQDSEKIFIINLITKQKLNGI